MTDADRPALDERVRRNAGQTLFPAILVLVLGWVLLRPEAVWEVDARLQYLADGSRARSPDELSTVFLALGDLSVEEAAARSDGVNPGT